MLDNRHAESLVMLNSTNDWSRIERTMEEVPEHCSSRFCPYCLERMVERRQLDRVNHYQRSDTTAQHLVFEEGSCKSQEEGFLVRARDGGREERGMINVRTWLNE